MSKDRAWRLISGVFGLVGVGYLVITLRAGATELQGPPQPTPAAWAAMALAIAVSLMVAYRGVRLGRCVSRCCGLVKAGRRGKRSTRPNTTDPRPGPGVRLS